VTGHGIGSRLLAVAKRARPRGLRLWTFASNTGARRFYGDQPWLQQAGVTVFAPFPRDAPMIGPPEHSWMINFRVDDLDAIVTQLRSAGETVDVDPQRYPNGLFAELSDPEGNRVQLWQPMSPE
jgi:glyoxylase I family protein